MHENLVSLYLDSKREVLLVNVLIGQFLWLDLIDTTHGYKWDPTRTPGEASVTPSIWQQYATTQFLQPKWPQFSVCNFLQLFFSFPVSLFTLQINWFTLNPSLEWKLWWSKWAAEVKFRPYMYLQIYSYSQPKMIVLPTLQCILKSTIYFLWKLVTSKSLSL